MGKNTKITWTDHTYNIVWGCTKVSDGCENCYAQPWAKRCGFDVWGPKKPRRTFGAEHWAEPLAWNADAEKDGLRRRVFACSMCDVFEDHHTVARERDKLWPLIRCTPNLDWLILTKRPARIAKCLPADWGEGYPNVWLGTSIEEMRVAYRGDELAKVPAVVRFISYEPALGPLDDLDLSGIDFLIYGGESGPTFRPDNLDWARTMRTKCRAAGIAFFFKQRAGRKPGTEPTLDGKTYHEYPTPRIVTPVACASFVNASLVAEKAA